MRDKFGVGSVVSVTDGPTTRPDLRGRTGHQALTILAMNNGQTLAIDRHARLVLMAVVSGLCIADVVVPAVGTVEHDGDVAVALAGGVLCSEAVAAAERCSRDRGDDVGGSVEVVCQLGEVIVLCRSCCMKMGVLKLVLMLVLMLMIEVVSYSCSSTGPYVCSNFLGYLRVS